MAQLVEHNLAKVGVAGSSPVVRSIWAFSSGGERFPDTEEVRSFKSSNAHQMFAAQRLCPLGCFVFCHQARRQISHQILIQGPYAMVFVSRRGAGRLHVSWPIMTATCWSRTIFWILLARAAWFWCYLAAARLRGFQNCCAGSWVDNVLAVCQEAFIYNASAN